MDAHAAPFCFCCEALVLLNTDWGAGISIGRKLLPTKAAKAGKIGNKDVVQALVRALVVEDVKEVIEAALLCSKGCRRWLGHTPPSKCDASARGGRFVVADPLECAHAPLSGIRPWHSRNNA
jgi:hypothetical protein